MQSKKPTNVVAIKKSTNAVVSQEHINIVSPTNHASSIVTAKESITISMTTVNQGNRPAPIITPTQSTTNKPVPIATPNQCNTNEPAPIAAPNKNITNKPVSSIVAALNKCTPVADQQLIFLSSSTKPVPSIVVVSPKPTNVLAIKKTTSIVANQDLVIIKPMPFIVAVSQKTTNVVAIKKTTNVMVNQELLNQTKPMPSIIATKTIPPMPW